MPLHVVLISPRNPLNIGAVARAMSNFGFLDLRLVNPYRVAFDEARSGVNAGEVLRGAREYATFAEAVADSSLVVGATGTSFRDLKTPVYRLEQGASPLREAMATSETSLVFGSEKYGLAREEISYCHHLVHIPTRPAHDSMNLGQAVAVCLYELVRDQSAVSAPAKRPKRASVETLNRLHSLLFRLLKASGYVKPRIAVSTGEKLRQLVLRLNLGAVDANLLLGMVRQIELALEREDVRRSALRDWPLLPPVSSGDSTETPQD